MKNFLIGLLMITNSSYVLANGDYLTHYRKCHVELFWAINNAGVWVLDTSTNTGTLYAAGDTGASGGDALVGDNNAFVNIVGNKLVYTSNGYKQIWVLVLSTNISQNWNSTNTADAAVRDVIGDALFNSMQAGTFYDEDDGYFISGGIGGT